jgi:hypothetical protein
MNELLNSTLNLLSSHGVKEIPTYMWSHFIIFHFQQNYVFVSCHLRDEILSSSNFLLLNLSFLFLFYCLLFIQLKKIGRCRLNCTTSGAIWTVLDLSPVISIPHIWSFHINSYLNYLSLYFSYLPKEKIWFLFMNTVTPTSFYLYFFIL